MRIWLCLLLLIGACDRPKEVPLKAAHQASDSPGVRRTMARALLEAGRNQEALEQLRLALKEEGEPGDARTHALLGRTLRELRFFPEAEAALKRALEIDPKLAEAWDARGLLGVYMGEPEEALRDLREACRLAPDTAEYQNNLGFALYLLGRHAEAVEALRRAVVLQPNLPRYRNNLGFALGALGDDAGARAAFVAAGGPAQAENNLGLLFERRGELERAREAYAQALKLDPSLGEAQRNLSRLGGTQTSEALP